MSADALAHKMWVCLPKRQHWEGYSIAPKTLTGKEVLKKIVSGLQKSEELTSGTSEINGTDKTKKALHQGRHLPSGQ